MKDGRKKKNCRNSGKSRQNNNDKVVGVDDDLFDIIGIRRTTRPDIMKRMWRYIRDNDLQDPEDGHFIFPDAKMSRVMGRKRVNAFTTMAKKINPHVKK